MEKIHKKEINIAIFTYFRALAKSPSTISMIEMLINNGYHLDLFIDKNQVLPLPEFKSIDVVYHTSSSKNILYKSLSWLGKYSQNIFSAFYYLINKKYLCLIGIDQEGIIVSSILGKIFRIPIIYYSLELFYWSDMQSIKHKVKKTFEIWGHRQAILTIIQDEVRGNRLLSENHISKMKMVYVPNSSYVNSKKNLNRRYLYNKFNIPYDKLIILMAGGIGDWTMSKKLAKVAKTWPEEWVLVIHGEGKEDYLINLNKLCDGKKIILSDTMVPFSELDDLISSSGIGLALYENTHKGIFEMSKASGKIWQYLRCGVPVITMKFPSLVDIIEKERCGVCIENENGIKCAIERILLDYEKYSVNSIKCHNNHGDFEKGFNEVMSFIDQV